MLQISLEKYHNWQQWEEKHILGGERTPQIMKISRGKNKTV